MGTKSLIKIIFIFVIDINLTFYINAQNNNTIVKEINEVYELGVNIDEIYGILDLSLLVAEYQLCTIIGQPFLLLINIIDQNTISITITTYNYSYIETNFTFQKNNKDNGYFYYKEVLVLVLDYTKNFNDLFFYLNELKTTISYLPDFNIENNYNFNYFVHSDKKILHFKYNNNKIYFDCKDLLNLSRRKVQYRLYKIKENDTWNSISQNFNCQFKVLKKINNKIEKKLPEKDYLIIIEYEYENKKIININRVQ